MARRFSSSVPAMTLAWTFVALLGCASAPAPEPPTLSVSAPLQSVSPKASAPSSWDGRVEGNTCKERVASWKQRAEALDVEVIRLERIPGWPTLSRDGGHSVPEGRTLFVDEDGRVFDPWTDRTGPAAEIVDGLGARTAPKVWILPTPHADLAAVVDLATRVRRLGSDAFLVVASTSLPGVSAGPRTRALIEGAATSSERAKRIALALPSALEGCASTSDLLRKLGGEPDRGRALVDRLTEGLERDGCTCDVDTALELAAYAVFGGQPAVGKPFVVALSERDARVLHPKSVETLFDALPDEATPVDVVLP